MLERETELIIQALTEQTIGSAHSLALKDVLATSIPGSIKLYLQSEISLLMQEDLLSASHFSRLPLTTPLVRRLTNGYTQALALEYILTREEFVTLLENGVHFVENYLCRPQWTLEHFIFEKGPRVTLAELQRKFGYVCEYSYFGRLVEGFMLRRGWQDMGIDDFRSLITGIDHRIVSLHSPAELAHLTRPIYEFLLLGQDVANKPIPLSALLVFFEDKEMKPLMQYIEQICHIRAADQLTIEQLAAIIGDSGIIPGAGRGQAGMAVPKTKHAEAPVEPLPAPEPVAPLPEASRAVEPSPEPQSDAGGDRRNVALSLTYSGMIEHPSSSPLQDLRVAIAPEQRDRFIRTLFNNDESHYNVVIETLNDMRTWKDASLYLQTFYQTIGINPTLPEAAEFNDIVQLRYLGQPQS